MSRHFCCCIPVRIAVFITSLLAFLVSGLVAAISWFVLIKTQNPNNILSQLTKTEKTAFGIIGGVYSLIAIISLFGFIGSLIRKRNFVAAYSKMCYVIFVVQCAASGFLIFSLFHDTSIDGFKCQLLVNGQDEVCNAIPRDTKIVIIVFLILELLIQGYIITVIHRYVLQLDEEQSYHRTSGSIEIAFKGPTTTYYPPRPLKQDRGLLAPQGHYPYSDPHHSFGR